MHMFRNQDLQDILCAETYQHRFNIVEDIEDYLDDIVETGNSSSSSSSCCCCCLQAA